MNLLPKRNISEEPPESIMFESGIWTAVLFDIIGWPIVVDCPELLVCSSM